MSRSLKVHHSMGIIDLQRHKYDMKSSTARLTVATASLVGVSRAMRYGFPEKPNLRKVKRVPGMLADSTLVFAAYPHAKV